MKFELIDVTIKELFITVIMYSYNSMPYYIFLHNCKIIRNDIFTCNVIKTLQIFVHEQKASLTDCCRSLLWKCYQILLVKCCIRFCNSVWTVGITLVSCSSCSGWRLYWNLAELPTKNSTHHVPCSYGHPGSSS